jgi:Zn-dependent M28 family amino/carboxypeptidase
MRRLFLWVLVSGLFLQSYAQVAPLPAANPLIQKYGALITAEGARKHLTILASDEFEGRETGKPGADKAANYIASEFKKLGLIAPVGNSYFQKVPMQENSFVVNSFIVNKTPFSNWKDFYFTGIAATGAAIDSKEIVFVGYGISTQSYDDLLNLNIAGKVVMVINSGEPSKDGISALTKTRDQSIWSLDRNMRIRFLRNKGAALILSVDQELVSRLPINGGRPPKPRLSIKADDIMPMQQVAPVVNITDSIANVFLKSSGKTFAALKAEIDNSFTPKTQIIKADFTTSFGPKVTDVNAVNVLGFMEGTDLKDEVLVFSAHYDHIGLNIDGPDKINNGADDDGSGTTAILEIARAFANAKKEGKGPRRSILFLGNVGEEQGLLGSEWYTDNPVFPLAKTITNLNIDMIGRVDPEHVSDPNYCYLVGSDKLSSDLHKISEETNAIYTKLKIDYKFNDPKDPEQIYYRSDHYNFAKHNVPIIFYFNGIHEDYHRPGDEVSKINFDILAKRAQLVFYTGWELANRDKRPVVNTPANTPNK